MTLYYSAGVDWFRGFMKRNALSIRTPEATSLARQAGFNRPAIEGFFEKLASALDR